MLTLAIDTSTPQASLALTRGDELLKELNFDAPARVGEQLFGRFDELLGPAHPEALELIAVGIGPGSFTGTRVGLATAKALAFSLDVPLVGVCSLRVVAAATRGPAAVAMTAFRGEVYAAAFDQDDTLLAPFAAKPGDARARIEHALSERKLALRSWHGTATAQYPDVFGESSTAMFPRARHVAQLALRKLALHGADQLAALEPAYVRGADVTTPKKASALGKTR